jgi:DNA replication protein DnaC
MDDTRATSGTLNLPFSKWPRVLGDERMAGALLDRLTHRALMLEIDGEGN